MEQGGKRIYVQVYIKKGREEKKYLSGQEQPGKKSMNNRLTLLQKI